MALCQVLEDARAGQWSRKDISADHVDGGASTGSTPNAENSRSETVTSEADLLGISPGAAGVVQPPPSPHDVPRLAPPGHDTPQRSRNPASESAVAVVVAVAAPETPSALRQLRPPPDPFEATGSPGRELPWESSVPDAFDDFEVPPKSVALPLPAMLASAESETAVAVAPARSSASSTNPFDDPPEVVPVPLTDTLFADLGPVFKSK